MQKHSIALHASTICRSPGRGYLLVWLALIVLLAGVLAPVQPVAVASTVTTPPTANTSIPAGLSAQEWASVQEQIGQEQARLAVDTEGSTDATALVNTISISNETKLLAAGNPQDHFGHVVAIHGDRMVVGVPDADINGNADQGAVYIFKRTDGKWSWTYQLFDPRGRAGDRFGAAIDLDASGVAVGAPGYDGWDGMHPDRGAAYVFNADFREQQKLAAEGTVIDEFGRVALDGNTLMVAGYHGVYVFTRGGTSWHMTQKLPYGGSAIALDGDVALIGNPYADNHKGMAYIFVFDGYIWREQAKLSNPDGQNSSKFGQAVALDGDTALITAGLIGARKYQGAVYAFTRSSSGEWSQQVKFVDPEGNKPDNAFGWAADAPSIQRLAGAPEVAAGTFLPHPYEDSGQVLHKIGMQYEGCQREHYRHGDRFEDTHLYGILRRDFDAG